MLQPSETNPYAAPRCSCDESFIRFSAGLKHLAVATAVVVMMQIVVGTATAVVLDRDAGQSQGFVVGTILLTVVLSALLAFVLSVRSGSASLEITWSALAALTAWCSYLLGVLGGSIVAGAAVTDRFAQPVWLVLMTAMTALFSQYFLRSVRHCSCRRNRPSVADTE